MSALLGYEADMLLQAARDLVSVPEETIRDFAQGLCVFCGEGWAMVGKAFRHVDAHAPNCLFRRLHRVVGLIDDEERDA